MTLQQRKAAPHRMLVARQGNSTSPLPGTIPDPPPTTPTSAPQPTSPPTSSQQDTSTKATTTTPDRTSTTPDRTSTPVQTTSIPPAPSTTTRAPSPPPLVSTPVSNPPSTPTTALTTSATHNDGGSSSYYTPSRTATGDPSVAATISASDGPASASGVAAGPVAAGILGGLAGLAILGFVIALFLRRVNRRRRLSSFQPPRDFGIFGTNSPAASGIEIRPHIGDHNVAPSISSSTAMNLARDSSSGTTNTLPSTMTGGAVPPSEALATATAAAGSHLHERPKYVFGQAPSGPDRVYDGQSGYDDGAYAHANATPAAIAYASSSGADAYAYQDATRGGYQVAASDDQTGQTPQGYYYTTAYAANAGQYYDYPQYDHQQQQGQGQRRERMG